MILEPQNLFGNIPCEVPQEMCQTLLNATACRIQRIVSQGHCSPTDFWYDQLESEWVLVLQGEAVLQFRDAASKVTMKAGDFVNIPAHRLHRVDWTHPETPTIWLAIFYRDEQSP